MSKVVRLTESDLAKLVERVINEQSSVKRTCAVGEKGTLVGTTFGGKKVFGLSKTESNKDAFCYIPDPETHITKTFSPQS